MFQPKKPTWLAPWSQPVDATEIIDLRAQIAAVQKHQATIEFTPDSTIITANNNFLDLMGYTLGEVRGKPHSIFVEPEYRNSSEYRVFWDRLRAGEFQTGQFRRVGRGGKEVWIQGTYTPVVDEHGKTTRVVKYAVDVTERKKLELAASAAAAEFRAQIEAVQKHQAVIEFAPDSTILSANTIFLDLMGYTLAEVAGNSHSMFVDAEYRNSNEYRMFWNKLRAGEFQTGQFHRLGRGDKEVWIQGTYTPVVDATGRTIRGGEICRRRHRAKTGGVEGERAGCGLSRADRGGVEEPGGDRIPGRRDDPAREFDLSRFDGLQPGRSAWQSSQHVRRSGRSQGRRLSRILGQAARRRIPDRPVSPRWPRRQGGVDTGHLYADRRRHGQGGAGRKIRHRRERAREGGPGRH